jgi:16S rRNA (guanine1207-N2)-methyltransferase
MTKKDQYYFTKNPDVDTRIYTISESLRKHLYIFKTINAVFSFKKIDLGTKILIENMIIPKAPLVLLDLGCGYGPIGMVLGYESPESQIVFVEINKRAIWCTKENIKINLPDSKERITVLQGDYLKPIKEKNIKIDGIYMNPPMRKGRKEFLNLCDEIITFLEPKGFFQFVVRKKMGASYIFNYLKSSYESKHILIEVLCKRSGYWVFRLNLNLR